MTRLFIRACLSLVFALMFTGCTYVAAVSQTNVPANRGKVVRASSKRFMVLLINFDNDYPYKLISALKAQCPNGRVRGLITKDSYTLYFLTFFWQRQQEAKGYCVSAKDQTAGQFEQVDFAEIPVDSESETEEVKDDVGTEIVEP